MGSGSYSALSGSIAKMQALDTYANNLSNANTFGFKKDRVNFESVLNGAEQTGSANGINFTRTGISHIDLSQGTNQPTGNTLDFAIDGEGFFKVQGESGSYYTRLGRFSLDSDGTLKTSSGYSVLGSNENPLVLPDRNVEVDEQGRIFSQGSEVGQLGIFAVADPTMLRKEGNGLFSLPMGVSDQPAEESIVQSGYLETSNVNIIQEMALMMNTLRTFEAYQKVLKTYSTIGSKLNDLGSLG